MKLKFEWDFGTTRMGEAEMSGQISTQDITTFEITTGEKEDVMTWKVYAKGTAFLRPFYLEKDGEPYRRKGGAIVYYGSREAAQDAADKMNGARSEYLRGLEDAAKVADTAENEATRIARLHPEESKSRDLLFVRAREAYRVAAAIRALAKEGGE